MEMPYEIRHKTQTKHLASIPGIVAQRTHEYEWSSIKYRIIANKLLATSQWFIGLEQVLSFPTVVLDWKSDYFWRSYGHLCKKFKFLHNWPYLCQIWSDFQSETTVGKLRTSPISSQKQNGDNTVMIIHILEWYYFMSWYLGNRITVEIPSLPSILLQVSKLCQRSWKHGEKWCWKNKCFLKFILKFCI